MATVNILVTARNQASSAMGAVIGQFRALGNTGQQAAQDIRNRLTQVNAVVGSLSQQLNSAENEASGLRAAINNLGSAAPQQLRDALHSAENRAEGLRFALSRSTREANQLNRALNRIDRGQAIRSITQGLFGMVRAIGSGVAGLRNMVSGVVLLRVAIGVALTPVVLNAAAAVADLTGLIQLLAPAAIAAAAAMVTLKMGFHGVSDALEAGLSGDVDKFKEALKKLSPQAAGTVRALVEIGKSWRNVRRDVQDRLFHNMGRELLDLNAVIQPLAAKWLPSIAQGFNTAAKGLASLFKESAATGQLDKIMQGVEMAITGILGSIRPLTQAFLDIAEVAAPSLGEAGQSIASLAERFAAWIRGLKEDGSLKEWLDRAKETFGDIKNGVKDAFDFIRTEVIPVINDIRERWDHFAETVGRIRDELQPVVEFLRGAFEDMRDAVNRNWEDISRLGSLIRILILPLIGLFAVQVGALVVAFTVAMEVLAAFGRLWDWLAEQVLRAVSFILGAMAGILSAAANAARALGMDGLADRLDATADRIRGFRDTVNNYLEGIRDQTVNVTVRYREVGRSVAVGPNYETGTGGRASGGIAGGLTMVGERGMELVRLPHGSQVYSAEDTQRMLAGGSAAAAVHITVAAARGGVGDPLAEAFLGLLRTGRLQLRAGGDPVLAARV